MADPPAADEAGDGWDDAEPTRFGRSRGGCGPACSSRGADGPVSDLERPSPFDVCGPLPTGRHRARGERGHRQDVHDRRARRALRRRGHAAGAAAARHVHADGDRRAARARPGAARLRRGGPRPRAGRRAARHRRARDLLADGPLAEVAAAPPAPAARARRSSTRATIATTHGFCQEVLGGLGIDGDVEPDAVVRRGRPRPARRRRRRPLRPPLPQPRHARTSTARRRCGSRRSPSPTRRRRSSRTARPRTRSRRCASRLAQAVRVELERRKRRHGRHDLRRPADAAGRRRSGRATPRPPRLRERYSVVLVDEFQDTDPVQWDIMRRAFGTGDVTLVLIGDPKQAIYAFRGADVYAYLEAARGGGARARRSTSTGAATRACSTPTTRCSAARGSGTRASSTGTSRPRPATASRGSPARPSARRCASASSTATTRG